LPNASAILSFNGEVREVDHVISDDETAFPILVYCDSSIERR